MMSETVRHDLLKIVDRLTSGQFYQDYDEDVRLLEVLQAHVSIVTHVEPFPTMTERRPSHYVLCRGTNSMVKEGRFFESQRDNGNSNGDNTWHKAWKPVYVLVGDDPGLGIEAARELAAHMTPIGFMWRTLEPHLPDEDAMNPHSDIYKACRGKWRSPIA